MHERRGTPPPQGERKRPAATEWRGRIRRRLVDYRNPNSLSSRIRSRRLHVVRELIERIAGGAPIRILDVGGTASFWRLVGYDFLRGQNASVTLVNLGAIDIPADASDILSSQAGDGRDLSQFQDGQFDLGFSNSVIEHVGGADDQQRFASELRRVTRAYYLQTPNFWFPLELHYVAPFVHWLPLGIRARLLTLSVISMERKPRDLAHARKIAAGIQLLTRGEVRALFPDAAISYERFAGLPKSIIAIRIP